MSRIPRSSLFYIILVAALGIVFWFTWQSIENSSKGDQWAYSTLINKSADHQVSKLVIKGSDGTATDKNGAQHDVNFGDNTDSVANQLTKDGVEVTYQQSSSGGLLLETLLPNLIFLLLIGGFMYYILRQTQSGNNQAM